MAEAEATERRVALVIGNNNYVNAAPLRNPHNDAEAIANVLARIGFKTILGINLGRDAMEDKFTEYEVAIQQASAAMLFYAGHGLQVKGHNYLIPVDADIHQEIQLRRRAFSLDELLEIMVRRACASLIFLDACRDNPFSRSLLSGISETEQKRYMIRSGLAEVKASQGSFIAFATAPDNVALDGKGDHSPFTEALLTHIETPDISVSDMMISVRKDVLEITDGKQEPWDQSSLRERFCFVEKPSSLSKHTRFDPREMEQTFWTNIENLNDAGLFEDFLEQFPESVYSALAKRKLQELKEEARAKAEAEAKQKAEEDARAKAEAEAKRKAEEDARVKAEAEAKRKAEEEARAKAEAEAKRKAEEDARAKAEARQKAEEKSFAKDETKQKRQKGRSDTRGPWTIVVILVAVLLVLGAVGGYFLWQYYADDRFFAYAKIVGDKNTLEYYIKHYSYHKNEAYELLRALDDTEYDKAVATGKIKALNDYISKWPHSKNVKRAKQYIRAITADREFDEAVATGKIKALNDYISKWPNSKNVKRARQYISTIIDDREFDEAVATGKIKALNDYISKWPHSKNVKRARQYIRAITDDREFDEAVATGKIKVLNDYISKWPNSKNVKQAKLYISTIQVLDAFNGMKTKLLKLKLSSGDDRAFLKAIRNNTVVSYEKYCNEWPKGKYITQAKLRLDKLRKIGNIRDIQEMLIWTARYETLKNGKLTDLTAQRMLIKAVNAKRLANGNLSELTKRAIKSFQASINVPDTGVLTESDFDKLNAQAQSRRDAAGFSLIHDLKTGIKIGLPRKFLKQKNDQGDDVNWSGDDELEIDLIQRTGGLTLTQAYDNMRSVKGREIKHHLHGDGWFIIAGIDILNGNDTNMEFYVKMVENNGRIRGFSIVYLAREEQKFFPIALAMSSTFEAFQ